MELKPGCDTVAWTERASPGELLGDETMGTVCFSRGRKLPALRKARMESDEQAQPSAAREARWHLQMERMRAIIGTQLPVGCPSD